LLCGAAAQASTTVIDFNTDPVAAGLVTSITGTADYGGQWISYDGRNYPTDIYDGFLQITAAQNSQNGKAVFPDFDHGKIVQGFSFDCWVRVGNGTGSTTPADGFSISFARAGDPAITGNTWNGNGQEEGTTTGIAIGFDCYQNSTDDPRAIDVWVDGVQILQAAMPTLNGTVTDPTSLQTGPNDGTGQYYNLGWAHLIVELTTDGQLSVTYKDYMLLDHYQTSYAPGPGQLVLAGRTGGLNENQDVDDITITTTLAENVLPGNAVGLADGVGVQFYDGAATVDTTKPATVSIDGGAAVPATRVVKDGVTTSVIWYSSPTLLDPGSSHTVQATITDNLDRVVTSPVLSFTVPSYSTVDPAWAVMGVDTSETGFRIRTWLSGVEPNNIWWANGQLAGQYGANLADTSSFTNGGFMNYTGVPNWDYFNTNTLVMNSDGNFQSGNGYDENAWPGLVPGANGPNIDNSSAEVLCYLYFQEPGPYRMGVNSDDGFTVNVGPNPGDWGSLMLGSFNGGRGASDTIFDFLVPTAGYYPFRLMWENGTGGANCEWFVQNPNGTKILINDPSTTNTTGIATYITGPALPAYVSYLAPAPNEANARPDQLVAMITDGSTTVTPAASLIVNGVSVNPVVIEKSGGVTTVSAPSDYLLPTGNSTAQLVYSTSGGGPFTNTWSFSAVQAVNPQWAVTGVETTTPGFKIMPWQSGNQPNNLRYTREQLAGLHGSNQADLSTATDGGYIDYLDVINFNITGSGNSGNFPNDVAFPGLPGFYYGDLGNESMRVLCYLQFDHAGLYTMGVNSDDGFAVTAGPNPMDWFAPVLGYFDGGRGPADTTFPVYVVTPGIYPFQLIWENGNGSAAGGNGAECEWFVVQPDGTKILLNDPAPPQDPGVKAYYAGTATMPAYVSVYSPAPGATGVAPNGFSVQLVDGSTTVTAGSISVSINGTAVTPLVAQAGGKTMVTLPVPLPPGTNTAEFVYNTSGTGGPFTHTWSFTVVTNIAPALPDSWLVTGVNTANSGFRIRPWQGGGANPNTIEWTERQLAGMFGPNNADLSLATDNGYVDYDGVINFDVAGPDGNFQPPDYYENAFPGIPGLTGSSDNSAMEVLTFLHFDHAGAYTMGVNSDDGFRVTSGVNPSDSFAPILGEFNVPGGRGASDTLFTFVVTNAGFYPFRLVWENGTGGCNCEWFTVQPDGLKVLLNDPNALENTGVQAYQAGPTLPANVAMYEPQTNAVGAFPDRIVLTFLTGSSEVNPASVVLLLDGEATPTPVVSQSGEVTTLTVTFPAPGMAPGLHTATLTWSDNATPPHTYTDTWTFTVGTFATLDPAMSVPATDVDATKPGFVLKVTQLDPATGGDAGDYTANQVDENNSLLAGLYFPWYGSNTVDTVTGGDAATPADLRNLWYWNNPADLKAVYSGAALYQGDFSYDYPVPGIPGTTTNANYFAAGFQSYVVFPTAGFHVMSVSSDDGFRVTEGIGITRQVIHVTGPGIDTDVAGVVASTNNSTMGGSMPVPPVSGPVVYIPYESPFTPTAIDLTNKIGVIQNNQGSLNDPSRWAWYLQTNGAIAAIIINDPTWGLPWLANGSYPVTIPVVMASGYAGQIDFWSTNTDLVASVGADAHPMLGQADRGKGMGAVDFGFYVPQPGAYPIRLLYYNGSGDAGCEWSTTVRASYGVAPERTLINDSSATGSLMAYRAVTVAPMLDTIGVADGMVTVTWQGAGTLQWSPSLNSPTWTNVEPQPGINTFTTPATGDAKFFRVIVPEPIEP